MTGRSVRPAELLELKVLDPAMGSGAFLVSACRYLADRIVEAWERDGYPDTVLAALGPDFNRDDAALEARRSVASRCLCGVDRDEAAVELGKLSLWLVTLAKDQPFSFLDHALRCGDSLVGLVSESQVVAFHLDPETGRYNNARLSGAIDEIAGPIMTRVLELREDIEAEPVRDPQQAAVAAAKLQEADGLTARLRNLADAVSAAALSTAGQPADAFDSRLNGIEGDAQRLLTQDGIKSPLEHAFRARLDAWLTRTPHRAHPPAALGPGVPRSHAPRWLRRRRQQPPVHGRPEAHRATRRGLSRVPDSGRRARQAGAAPTCAPTSCSAISQSRRRAGPASSPPTRSPRAIPAKLGLIRRLIWGGRSIEPRNPSAGPGRLRWRWPCSGRGIQASKKSAVLDGNRVAGITPSLDPQSRMRGNPYRLAANAGQSFQGSIVLGTGFIVDPEEAQDLIAKDPRNKAVLFPYLNGEDLNSRWDHTAEAG